MTLRRTVRTIGTALLMPLLLAMKATELITLATLAVLVLNVSAKDFSCEELQQRMLERRAVEVVIWGMPIVSVDAMRQA